MKNFKRLIVPEAFSPLSLERFLAQTLKIERLTIRKWIVEGYVTVDGGTYKPRRYIQPLQEICVNPPPLQAHSAEPQSLPIHIRYQDDDLIIVAKPGGMATHPGPNWWKGSCVNALLYAIKDWPGIGGIAGPGIVHRLDKDTSGLLIFAKSQKAQHILLQHLRSHQIHREYLAWVEGEFHARGIINKPLDRNPENPFIEAVVANGKRSITYFETLYSAPRYSLLRLTLATGRTHQIRVHMASTGHCVWGDKLYGREQPFMALHAWRLSFTHPISKKQMVFTEPVPESWQVFGDVAKVIKECRTISYV